MRAITVCEIQNFTRSKDIKGSLGVGMWGQINQIMKEQGKKIPKKDLIHLFITCSMEGRHDLEDFLLSQGLNINAQEHEILRVLAWTERNDAIIHLIQKRGADVDGAIKDANAHNEWKTVRKLEEIKEKIEKTESFPLKEDYNLPSKLSGEKGLNKRVLDVIDGVRICAVNGDFVRDKDDGLGFIAFVEGGNHYADSYPDYKKDIKENEIWLDDVHLTKPNDAAAIILHEMVERYQMKEHDLTYDKAHDIANEAEQLFRKKIHTGTGGKVWGKSIKNIEINES
jgi:hypothetical protein